jgi:hypothetical protein
MGVGPRCKAIGTLGFARGLDDSLLQSVRALSGDSVNTADWRARFIHDPWYVEGSSEKASQFRAMPHVDKRYGIHEIDKAELEKNIGKIKDLQERASKIRNDLSSALQALSKSSA